MTTVLIDYAPLFAFLGLVGGVAIWHACDFRLRPLFIPKAEINALADELIAKYGPRAEEMAYAEEDRAWRYSDTYQQGKWRRVRRELWRRYEAGDGNRGPDQLIRQTDIRAHGRVALALREEPATRTSRTPKARARMLHEPGSRFRTVPRSSSGDDETRLTGRL